MISFFFKRCAGGNSMGSREQYSQEIIWDFMVSGSSRFGFQYSFQWIYVNTLESIIHQPDSQFKSERYHLGTWMRWQHSTIFIWSRGRVNVTQVLLYYLQNMLYPRWDEKNSESDVQWVLFEGFHLAGHVESLERKAPDCVTLVIVTRVARQRTKRGKTGIPIRHYQAQNKILLLKVH